MKLREFDCLFDPERNELTYGYKHGCTDGYTEIKVREVSSGLDAAYAECEKALKNIEHNCACPTPEDCYDHAIEALTALKKARGE